MRSLAGTIPRVGNHQGHLAQLELTNGLARTIAGWEPKEGMHGKGALALTCSRGPTTHFLVSTTESSRLDP